MRRVFPLIIQLCLLPLAFAQGASECGQHVFALRGDTCDGLRVAFHMSSADFDQLNRNVDCDHLRPRQSKICVASKQQLRSWREDSDRRCPGPRVKAVRGDTCSKIGARLDVEEEHFMSNNRHVNCDNLSPGDIICGAQQYSDEPVEETMEQGQPSESSCVNGRMIELEDGDSCSSISRRYRVPVRQLEADNPSLDCNYATVGLRLCIRSGRDDVLAASISNDDDVTPFSNDDHRTTSISFASAVQSFQIDSDHEAHRSDSKQNFTRCPGKFVTAKGNETCAYLRDQHNINSETDFVALNPTLNCSKGPIERGRVVCITRPRVAYVDLTYTRRRGIENAQLAAVHCTKWYRITQEDTCWTIWNTAQLTPRVFFDLNPGLDCSSLKVGQGVCLKNLTTFSRPCRLTFTVQPGQTCSSIASLAKLTMAQLRNLNPALDCDRLEPKRQICLSIDDAFDAEARDAGQQQGSDTKAEHFLQSASTRLSQRSLIDAETAQQVQRLLGQDHGASADSAELIEVLAKEQSIALIKAVTQGDANFQRLASEFDQRRSLVCVQLTEGETAYKACVCDEDKPFIHCQAILMKDLQSTQNQQVRRHKRRHSSSRGKRNRHEHYRQWNTAVSDLDFRIATTPKPPIAMSNAMATVGGAFADFWRFFQKLCPNCVEQGCLAVGACFMIPQAPVFEVCVSGGACLPNPAMLITSEGRLTVNQFFSSQINVGVGVCITGVNAVFKLVGLAACVVSIDLRYYYLRQQIELQPQIALVAVRAYLVALIQVADSLSTKLYDSDNNVPLADLCLEEAYQCSDFCQLDRGGVVVRYNVEVWFFGWRSVKKGDVKGLPECRPKTLPPPDTLKRLVVFVSGNSIANTTRSDYCKLHDLSLKDIPTNLGITHVVYSYLAIDSSTFRIVDTGHSQAIGDLARLKDSGLRLMVSIGGRAFCENDSTKSIFANMVRSSATRRAFIDSTIEYLKRHSLHGIDIAWTNPQPADNSGFIALISEMRAGIDRAGGDLLISISVPRSSKTFDIAPIHRNVDFLNLMTFDYHEPKDSYKTDGINVHSPVVDCSCSEEGDVELTLEEYLNGGVPAQKLNLGLSTFGRAFKLDQSWRREDTAAGYVVGDCTKSPGLLAWYEIKTLVEEIRIDNKTMSAYSAYGNMEWVGFDNRDTLAMKMCFARYKLLGGVAVWNANFDDNYELIESVGRLIKTPALHNCSDIEISKCDQSGNATRRYAAPEERVDSRASISRPSRPQSSKPQSSGTPTCSSFAPADSKRCSQAICTTPPSAVNGDRAKLSQCANKATGSACTVECLPGYRVSSATATTVCVRLFSSFAMWLPPVKCEMTEEGKRACGGDAQIPVVPIFLNASSTAPQYVLKFNKASRIPVWSAYLSKKVDAASSNARDYRFSRYKCHQENQIRASQYRNMTNYVKSQLTPQIAFNSAEGRRSANYMMNIAAQEKNARYGPWNVLQRRVDSFSEAYPAVVATGVCPVTVDQASRSDNASVVPIPIPSCFWKLVCVRAQISGSTRASVSGYYHENVSPIGTEASARIDQIKQIRDQSFIKGKLGPSESAVAEIWTSVKQWLWSSVSSNDFPSPEECAGRSTLGNDELRFWRRMIDDEQYGPGWRDFDDEAARADASDVDEEEDLVSDDYLTYGVRRQPYERCGRIINGQRRK